ncbi:hypothetical protein [Polymorphospora sp. NPDC050346]|uniref:hypothetical protein n=1 Tax=Polymorphospora sp. NPDC050346 TaxID=3155780 RepID=UPI0033FDC4E8
MTTIDVVLAAGSGIVAGLTGTIGVALLLRSRRHRDAVMWRGGRMGAPRLLGSMFVLIGLAMATMTVSRVFFEPGGGADGLMFLVGTVFVGAAIVTGVRWFHRRDEHRTAG